MTRPVDPLAGQLRQIREAAGLSLNRVEDKSASRFKASVVGSWERGFRQPTVRDARELLDFYGHRLEILAPGDVALRAGQAVNHEDGAFVEYVVKYGPGLDHVIVCEDVVEARRIASHMPGSRVAFRAKVVGELTFVDGDS